MPWFGVERLPNVQRILEGRLLIRPRIVVGRNRKLEGFKIEVVLRKLQPTQKIADGLAVNMRFARQQGRTLDRPAP